MSTSTQYVAKRNVDYDSASPSEGSRRFRRELLERIRQELFATAECEPGPVEQRLLRQVAGIIQRCESDLLISSNPTSFSTTPQFLHPTMPTHRRASAPSILADENPPSQSVFQTPGFEADPTYTPAIASSFDPSTRPTSPRTMDPFHTVPQVSADVPFVQNEPPSITYTDPYTFSSNDWIDWNLVFPPGPEVQTAERTDAHPRLTTPVWT
jgi:hypothetical protein